MKNNKKNLLFFSTFLMFFFTILLSNNIYADNITQEPTINSKAAIILDRKTNTILYEKNSNEIRKMASTTKIMTAIIVLENAKNLNKTVTISKKSSSIGGSVLGLRTGEKISIKNLLYALMLKSGNDTAIALAEEIGGNIENFSSLMNKKAATLGLSHTHFVTPHGLDSDEHYTTAYELALLSNYALNNKIFKEIVSTKYYTISTNIRTFNLSNGNELLANFPGIYGVKTGFTNGANRCLVTACKQNDLDIITVVLGAETKNIRTKDSIKLLNYAFNNFKYINLTNRINDFFNKWNDSNFFKISKGKESYINLKLSSINNAQFPIKNNNINKINFNVEINSNTFLIAPIYENTKFGELVISIKNNEILKIPILIKNTVEKKDILDYLIECFKCIKHSMVEISII